MFYSNQGGGGVGGPLYPLAMPVPVVQPGFVNHRVKARVWERGFPPPTVGRFFFVENSCMKLAFSCTLNAIIRGYSYVRWHIPIPYSPFKKNSFTPIIKGSMGPNVPLIAMPVTIVQPEFVNGGQSEGAKRPSGERVWEGRGSLPLPTVVRFF